MAGLNTAAPPDAYLQAILDARRRMFVLEGDGAQKVAGALSRFLSDVEAELGNVPTAERRRRANEVSREVVGGLSANLYETVAQAGERNRQVAFDAVYDRWQQAMQQVARAEGVPSRLLGGVRVPAATMLHVFESVGSEERWTTLLRDHTALAGREAALLVEQAIAGGMDPQAASRKLRRYMEGAEEVAAIFPGEEAINLNLVPAHLRGAARHLAFNADRLMVTEVHNARAEAEIAHMLNDPLVEAVEWALSPNRGTGRVPDICDVFARQDAYGLGPGIYPILAVPPPPHPFDRCERHPVVRSGRAAELPKPFPPRRELPKDLRRLPGMPEMSTARAERLRGEVQRFDRLAEEIWQEVRPKVPDEMFAANVSATQLRSTDRGSVAQPPTSAPAPQPPTSAQPPKPVPTPAEAPPAPTPTPSARAPRDLPTDAKTLSTGEPEVLNSGINESARVRVEGTDYFVKWPRALDQGSAEAEVGVAKVAEWLGYGDLVPRTEFVDGKLSRPFVKRLKDAGIDTSNIAGIKPTVSEWLEGERAMWRFSEQERAALPREDRERLLLLDFVADTGDRHDQNYVVVVQGDRTRVLGVDYELSFLGQELIDLQMAIETLAMNDIGPAGFPTARIPKSLVRRLLLVRDDPGSGDRLRQLLPGHPEWARIVERNLERLRVKVENDPGDFILLP